MLGRLYHSKKRNARVREKENVLKTEYQYTFDGAEGQREGNCILNRKKNKTHIKQNPKEFVICAFSPLISFLHHSLFKSFKFLFWFLWNHEKGRRHYFMCSKVTGSSFSMPYAKKKRIGVKKMKNQCWWIFIKYQHTYIFSGTNVSFVFLVWVVFRGIGQWLLEFCVLSGVRGETGGEGYEIEPDFWKVLRFRLRLRQLHSHRCGEYKVNQRKQ